MTAHRDGLLPNMEARLWADKVTVSYRYKPHGRPWMTLGTDKAAAVAAVLAMQQAEPGEGSLRWLWGQYKAKSKRWSRLGEATKTDYELAWKQIDAVLGHCLATTLTARDIARYVHVERSDSPRRADIEKTVLSGVFKYGVLIGACEANPAANVEPHGAEPKRTMPQTAALQRFLTWLDGQSPQRKVLACMAEYAELAGNRRCEFLQLSKPQVDRAEGVIRTFRAKQRGAKKGVVVEKVTITPRMSALLDKIEALSRDCLYLFPTRDNNAYTERGFKSLWQRAVLDAIEADVLKPGERFNFHALRRYYATMHVAQFDKLPNLHANPAVTASTYDATTEVSRSALK